jgi:hypothetical protein
MTRKSIAIAAVALFVGLGAGVSAAPAPTTVTVDREVTVEVVPQACTDAAHALLEQTQPYVQFTVDVLADYLDYPEENLQELGARVETRLVDLTLSEDEFPAIEACF